VIRGTILLALAYVAARVMRNRPASERHVLWVSALVVATALPVVGLVTPEWRPEVMSRIVSALPAVPQPSTPQNVGVHAVGIEPGSKVDSVLFFIWIGGVAVSLAMLIPGIRAVRRLRNEATVVDGVLISATNCPPMTWGIFRPRVLLPKNAVDWPPAKLHAVLAHELAHVKRRDWAFQMFAEMARALNWFNPLFWIARNQLHLESERACDDAVLSSGVDEKEYAQHLLDIARGLKRRQPAWTLAMAGQAHLEKRLMAVLDARTKRTHASWKTALVILIPLLAVALPVAAARFGPPPEVIRYTMPPLYSDEARRAKVEGVVKVEATIDIAGRPHDLRVVRGLGGYGLDQNALLAVRSWQFAPGRPGTTTVDVEFNLQNAALNDMIANDMVTAVGPDVIPPRIIRRVEPQFRKINGKVLLDVVINEDGVPKVVRVLQSFSWPADEAAINALEQWRFSPAEKNQEQVKVRMNIEMNF
jgi:TonB family protein